MGTIIAWIIIGGLAGWIASKIMKRDAQMGIGANIVAGVVGAFIVGWIFRSSPAAPRCRTPSPSPASSPRSSAPAW